MLDGITRIDRPAKITQTITERLRAMIASGVLKPGDKLPSEKELCDAFGVSRSSLREALQSLEHVGLIVPKPGIGRFLVEDAGYLLETLNYGQMLERASAFELLEARRHLEVAIARLAAERATDAEIAVLERALKNMEELQGKDLDAFFDNELEFHINLARACRNSVLTELDTMLIHRVAGQAERFLKTLPYTFELTIQQFRRILAALKEGDAAAAEQSMQEHLELVWHVMGKGHDRTQGGRGEA